MIGEGSSLVACHRHPNLHHPRVLQRHQAQCQPPASMHQSHRPFLPEKTSAHRIQRSPSLVHHLQCMVLWMQVPFVSRSLLRRRPSSTTPCPVSCQPMVSIMHGVRSTTPGQGPNHRGVHLRTHGIPMQRLGMVPALGRSHMAGPRPMALASMAEINPKRNTGGTLPFAICTNDQAQEYYLHT